jgi:Leucine-rich repeat (LRR) protein
MCSVCLYSDVSSNSISAIPKGTLPLGLRQLYLDRNSLTEIPPDVAEMQGLTDLYVLVSVQAHAQRVLTFMLFDYRYMDGNILREIPAKALPPLSMDYLSLVNCSLTAVPSVIEAMTALTPLSLAGNDLSHDPDFSVLPKSLIQLNVDYSRLSKFPSALQKLSNLQSLSVAWWIKQGVWDGN